MLFGIGSALANNPHSGKFAGGLAYTGELVTRVAEALAQSWSRETSAEPEAWSNRTPARGQCAVTALIIQDMFGGELLRCDVEQTSHYWNALPSGRQVDLTRQQFGSDFRPMAVERRSRDYVLSFPDTRARYSRLRRAVLVKLRRGDKQPDEGLT